MLRKIALGLVFCAALAAPAFPQTFRLNNNPSAGGNGGALPPSGPATVNINGTTSPMPALMIYPTHAALVAQALGFNTVLQQGNLAAGDGGFAIYTWNATSTTTPDGVSVILPPGQSVGVPGRYVLASTSTMTVDAKAFGLRQGGSVNSGVTATMTSGTSSISLSNAGDYQPGDDIRVDWAGANYSAGSPSNLTAVQQGTTGATSCTYYAAEDDGSGGLSAAISTTINNANASQTVDNPVAISVTPAVSHHTVLLWKNCGSGETYLGAAQPQILATMTPGSGYTQGGPYTYTATGGGCPTSEPAGFITVNALGQIRTDLGRIDPSTPGFGCTSAPTVAVPAGAGGGSGGAITLSLVANFDDAGMAQPTTPEYVPATHPTSSQPDWLIGTAGAVGGNVVTLCTVGSYPATCTALNASNSVSGAPARHSWTRVLSTALAAANPGNNQAGTANVQLPCGIFEIEAGAIAISNNDVLLSGGDSGVASNQCTHLVPSGNGPTVLATGTRDGVQGLYLDGSNKTGGYAADAILASQFTFQWNRSINNPGNLRILGANNGYVYDDPQCNNGWAYGLSDYDFESTISHLEIVLSADNIYCNDSNGTSTNSTRKQFSKHHNGYTFNDIQTFNGTDLQISDVGGYGWSLISTSGNTYNGPNRGGKTIGNNYFHCFGCDAEFSGLDDFNVQNCSDIFLEQCEFFGFLNGSLTGYELRTAPEANIAWKGGRLSGAWFGGAFLGGTKDSIVNTGIDANSQASSGIYPGVDIASSCILCDVTDSKIGDQGNVHIQSYPVTLDAPTTVATNASTGGISMSSPTIIMASVNPGSIGFNQQVYDGANRIGAVLWYQGTTLTLQGNAAYTGSAGDTLSFFGSGNEVCGNAFQNNSTNTVSDNSTALAGNVLCQNPGDSSPGYAWDNVDSLFGVGLNATFANNSSLPGLLARAPNPGGMVAATVTNTSPGAAGLGAEYQLSLTGLSNVFAKNVLTYNSGTPFYALQIGSGVTGGLQVDARGGGSSANLNLYGGSSGAVIVSPALTVTGGAAISGATSMGAATVNGSATINGNIGVTGSVTATGYISGSTAGVNCSGAPTGSFATSNGLVTHC